MHPSFGSDELRCCLVSTAAVHIHTEPYPLAAAGVPEAQFSYMLRESFKIATVFFKALAC